MDSGNGGVTAQKNMMVHTWSAGGALAIVRYSLAGAGTQTSALAFGGDMIIVN